MYSTEFLTHLYIAHSIGLIVSMSLIYKNDGHNQDKFHCRCIAFTACLVCRILRKQTQRNKVTPYTSSSVFVWYLKTELLYWPMRPLHIVAKCSKKRYELGKETAQGSWIERRGVKNIKVRYTPGKSELARYKDRESVAWNFNTSCKNHFTLMLLSAYAEQ